MERVYYYLISSFISLQLRNFSSRPFTNFTIIGSLYQNILTSSLLHLKLYLKPAPRTYLQSFTMSFTPKQQLPSSPFLTSTMPFNQPQTPLLLNQPHNKLEIISPLSVGGYEDIFGIYSNHESFPLSPRKDALTPLNEIQFARPSYQMVNPTPMFQKDQNHFEMTPKNGLQFLTPRQNRPQYQKLDFSPLQKTADKQHHVEDSFNTMKLYSQIKIQPNLKVQFQHFEEEEDEEEVIQRRPRSKKNCLKGLRNLSVTVADIVKEHQKVTYKDVATKLIVRFINQGKIPPKHNNQDIQNAKRRVYDALNVLIAANVLSKQGKFVSPCTKKPKQHPAFVQESIIQKLKLDISLKNKTLSHKNMKLKQLYNKYAAAVNLQQRNKQSKSKEKIIRFPFVFIRYPLDSKLEVTSVSQLSRSIKVSKPFQICGDIDMAIKLNLHKKKVKGLLSQQLIDYILQLQNQHNT